MAAVNQQVSLIQGRLNEIEEMIESIIMEPVRHARQLTAKDTGTVDVLVQGVMVKHCIDKKVVWDQKKLFEIWNRIKAAGDEPENYMTVKTTHSVREKAYDSFPEPVRAIFSEAREVKAGSPRITFDTGWRA